MTPPKNHILLVEDDQKLGASIVYELQEADYRVTWLKSGSDARLLEPDDFDLIVLDLMLPGRHGFDLLKDYRAKADTPVILLTARTDTQDKVRGLQLGADDYLTKPFWPEELLARIEARLRRPLIRRDADLIAGPLKLDLTARQVFVEDQPIELTRAEFDILAELARRPGMAVTRRQLVERVLPGESDNAERTLDVHVSRIRKKLADAAPMLETVWGIGYRLNANQTPNEES